MIIVLSGRPHLRTPEGWRQLEPGEVVALPRGPAGPHQVENRGDEEARFLMLSEMNAPEAIVYPDSDKVGVLSRPPARPATRTSWPPGSASTTRWTTGRARGNPSPAGGSTHDRRERDELPRPRRLSHNGSSESVGRRPISSLSLRLKARA
jgi:Cupin domain